MAEPTVESVYVRRALLRGLTDRWFEAKRGMDSALFPAIADALTDVVIDLLADLRCECCQGRCTCGGKRVSPPGGSTGE
jgi:hypothetical protein